MNSRTAGAVLLACLALGGCPERSPGSGAKDAGARADSGPEERLPVEVVPARRGPIERRLRFEGKLEPAHSVDRVCEGAGTLRRVLVEPGARVRRGQVLAELSNPEVGIALEQARIATRRAELQLDDLRRQEVAQQGLLAKGFSTKEELERVVRQREMAELALRESQVGLRQVELQAERLVVRSPITGIVASRSLHTAGQRLSPGSPAFRIVDPSRLLVRQRQPERSLRGLEPGRPAEVLPVAHPDLTLAARVEALSPVVDPHTGFRELTVELTSEAIAEAGERLRPGMFVRVSILIERKEQALLVPARALRHAAGGSILFVVRAGRATRVQPQLGLRDEGWVQVVEGVTEAEPIVVLGQARLSDGSRVRIVEAPKKTPSRGPSPPSGLRD